VKKPKPHYRQLNFRVDASSQASKHRLCKSHERLSGPGAMTGSAFMAINSVSGFDSGDAHKKPEDGAETFIDNYLSFERNPTVFAVCVR
jgi:hypothetical protein